MKNTTRGDDLGDSYKSEMKRADDDAIEYRDMMINHLDLLTLQYRDYLESRANLNYAEDLFTKCASEMIIVLSHLLPKLKGRGDKSEKVYNELNKYRPWLDEILTLKTKKGERQKIGDLYNSILDGYSLLGLTSI